MAALQARNLSDYSFQFWTERRTNVSGLFRFLAVCNSTVEDARGFDSLDGQIFIFVEESWAAQASFANSSIAAINARRSECGGTTAADLHQSLMTKLGTASDVSVKFSLKRNGIVRFDVPQFSNIDVLNDSAAFANDQMNVDLLEWIANQAYFYLRDICHLHQHHVPTMDTVLTLQDIRQKRDWRNSILYSLQHYVIRARRSNRVQDFYRAMGVLAYAKAFCNICDLAAENGSKGLSVFQYEAIGDSVSSKASEMESNITRGKSSRV